MRLAICMIVKNEEAHLERCLKSVQGLGDIYILDTGSIDRTCEIARKYTDKVFENEYKWNDNFAEARNYIKAKANADWIFSIDADEYLEQGQAVHHAFHKIIEDMELHGVNTMNVILKAEGTGATHTFPRLFRKSIDWKGAIHNYLSVSEQNKCDITIIYGYSEAHKKDPDRSLRILTKECEDPKKVREKFYLAREYWYRKDYQTAINWYDKYLQVAWWGPEMADANLMRARCYLAMKNYKMARRACLDAININADYKEALHFMAGLTGPNSSARWSQFADLATNKNVLFVNDIKDEREYQLDRCIPDLFKFKTVLYVGANTHRCHILPTFRNRGYEIDIVEPHKPNCDYYTGVIGIRNTYNVTIQEFNPEDKYDVVFWWHGPEHVKKEELESTLKHIESMTKKYVVLGCPWGNNPQEAIDGNYFEIHRSSMYVEDFEKLGYNVDTIGTKDNWNSNLIAWKKLEE